MIYRTMVDQEILDKARAHSQCHLELWTMAIAMGVPDHRLTVDYRKDDHGILRPEVSFQPRIRRDDRPLSA